MSFFVTFFSRKSQLQKRNVQALFTIFIWTVNGTILSEDRHSRMVPRYTK